MNTERVRKFDLRLTIWAAAAVVLLLAGTAVSGVVGLGLLAQSSGAAAAPPTNCNVLTPAETEGPYFKPGSPAEAVLDTPLMAGTRLMLSGYVVDTTCRPIAGAQLDFWQADASGQYDNSGYTLRGHVLTDANGFYQIETVVPGLYPGRTRHIHVKVQAPGQPVLTTQLYFPNEPRNAADGVFSDGGPQLLMNVQQAADGSMAGTYSFIIATG